MSSAGHVMDMIRRQRMNRNLQKQGNGKFGKAKYTSSKNGIFKNFIKDQSNKFIEKSGRKEESAFGIYIETFVLIVIAILCLFFFLS